MKRLTEKSRDRCDMCTSCVDGLCLGQGYPCDIYETYYRLAAIEDILGDDYDLDRLRELVKADREGRCVVLPCKIGSLVYSHARKLDGKDYVKETEFWWSDIPQIGKTVFLTREAAGEALRRKQNE